MNLLESDKLKVRILRILIKNPEGLSLNSLKRKVGACNYRSVSRNSYFLELAGLVVVEELMEIERKDGVQKYRLIKISESGRKMVEGLGGFVENLRFSPCGKS